MSFNFAFKLALQKRKHFRELKKSETENTSNQITESSHIICDPSRVIKRSFDGYIALN